ncbi:MAG: S9 family peptidase [Erysipelotrichaceae bacterium]|nr:S9 family peptidase [Erysipelotrichaceae bacterium]
MKPVTLDLMLNYRYLSDLKLHDSTHTLYYTETMADLDNNCYKQRLHQMNTQTKDSKVLIDWQKRCSTFLMNDGSLLLADHNPEISTVHTRFTKVNQDGAQYPAFTVPLAVGNIKDLNHDYYLVNATIHRSCPNYHHLSNEDQLKVEQLKKDNEDYVVFDEYPFFFNGAGIINGERNTLMLIHKRTLEITDLIPLTVDVESYDIDGDELIYSGVDFTDVKGLWSWVWKVNLKTLETEVLFDDVLMISRVFYMNHKVIVAGTNGTAVDGRDFYELKDKKLTLLMKNEGSLYNSVGSDCRYGRTKNYYKYNDISYFISTEDSHSDVLKYTGTAFEKMTSFEGSSDDMVIGKDGLWIIAMTEQKLQEVYEVVDGKPVQRSFLNEEVLKDVYVAKPHRLSIKNIDPIYGWVLLPKDYDPAKTYPAILDVHGGPKGVYGENFYHEMQAWASMGYFVMFCNPHCSDGRGNEFANFMKHYGVTDFEDIMLFVDEVLKTYPAIDPERVGVTGGSYGGYMTNWIIGHTDRFKCAASQRSVSNRITQMVYSDYGIDTPFEFGVEDIDDCYDLFWDRSPLKYSNNVKTPTLFIHATEDYRCPISEAIQLYTVLKCRGIDTKLVGFIGENHDLSRTGKPKHRLRRLNEITNWMNKYLN